MRLFTFVILITLTSCVTPPQSHVVENTKIISKSKDAVWNHIMEWMTSNRMQIKTIEKNSGIIYAERIHNLSAVYADCGKQAEQAILPTTGQFNVFVKPAARGKTSVTVNADYAAAFFNEFNGQYKVIPCNSKGALEKEILRAAGY